MADRRELLAQLLQQGNVTTGAAKPGMSILPGEHSNLPSGASVDKNRRLLEVLSQEVPMPRQQAGAIAPVDATRTAAVANIARGLFEGRTRKKSDEQSRELLVAELEMMNGGDPFKSEIQPIESPVLSGRVQIRPGEGADEAIDAVKAGVKPFVEATKATRQGEAEAASQHDLAAILDERAGPLAAQRLTASGPEWGDPEVDSATGSVVQRNSQTGEVREISRAAGSGAEAKPPASIAEYNLAKDQGYDGTFETWLNDRSRGQIVEFAGGKYIFNPATKQYTPVSTAEAETGAAVDRASAEAQAAADAKASAKADELAQANEQTLGVWNVARAGLMSGLEGTETGPVVGRMPAVTAGQQVAEGAVAAVAPVLKQLFRSAGEGIFTDKDQELLLNMVPKRTDHPEAITAKMENIDAIIQAKLGTSIEPPSEEVVETPESEELPPSDLPEGVTEEDIAFTMQKHGLTRNEVLERLNGS